MELEWDYRYYPNENYYFIYVLDEIETSIAVVYREEVAKHICKLHNKNL